MIKYRLHLVESERGWGQDYWHEDYDTRAEAEARKAYVNSFNTSTTAPDYYMQANEIELIEV